MDRWIKYDDNVFNLSQVTHFSISTHYNPCQTENYGIIAYLTSINDERGGNSLWFSTRFMSKRDIQVEIAKIIAGHFDMKTSMESPE